MVTLNQESVFYLNATNNAQLSHFLQNFVLNKDRSWPASDLEDHEKSIKLIENIFKTNQEN